MKKSQHRIAVYSLMQERDTMNTVMKSLLHYDSSACVSSANASVLNLENEIASLCHIAIMRGENQNRLRMDERKQNIQNDCRIP